MSWVDLEIGILEAFAEMQGLVVVYLADERWNEGHRLAWRERQTTRGECIKCRRPARPGSRICQVHHEASASSNAAWLEKNRERKKAYQKEWRRRKKEAA